MTESIAFEVSKFEHEGEVWELAKPVTLTVKADDEHGGYSIDTPWPDVRGWGETPEEAIAGLGYEWAEAWRIHVASERITDWTDNAREIRRDLLRAVKRWSGDE